MQLIIGRDAILNIKHTADWNLIKKRKQQLVEQNNIWENSKRIKHTYNVGDKILILANFRDSKYNDKYLGPYPIIRVNNNLTIKYRKGAVLDTINIR